METMGVDQYGKTYHALGAHPRAELLRRLGYRSAARMYVDRAGGAKHVGYVIGPHWVSLYTITPWDQMEKEAH